MPIRGSFGANASSNRPYNVISGGTTNDVTNYNGTGQTWRVHTIDTAGTNTLTVSHCPQTFRVLVVGGGGNGGNGGNPGQGGQVQDLSNYTIPRGNHTVTIGSATQSTSLGSLVTSTGGASQTGSAGGGTYSTITGTNTGYAGNGGKIWWNYCCPATQDPPGPGGGSGLSGGDASATFYGGGGGGCQHTNTTGPWNGYRGVVIISYRIA